MNKIKNTKLEKILKEKKIIFTNYQEIPSFILKNFKNSINFNEYKQKQIKLDTPRYKFLIKNTKVPKNVLEIGSNIGFFILNLSYYYKCKTIGFEPIKKYSNLTNEFAKLSKIQKMIKSNPKPINIKNIKNLPKSDLIIELNVLHHAGNYFDNEAVKKLGGWRNYAKKRLQLLRKKTSNLFFQTGNSGKETLFPSEKSVEFISELLKESGWKIKAFGTISNLDELKYKKGNLKNKSSYSNYECKRNKKLVDYKKNNKLVKSMITGMAARPLWICEKS